MQYQYRYDGDNALSEKLDYVNNQFYMYSGDTTSIYVLSFDENGNAEKGKFISSYSDTAVDDETENTSTRTHVNKVGSSTVTSVYSDKIDSFTTANGAFTITSNESDDVTTTELKNSENQTVYSYTNSSTENSANLKIKAGNVNKEYAYTYDDSGRITSYGSVKNGELDPYDSAYYHYDEKGQLTRVDEDLNGSTQTYTYDSHGNIKKVNHYAYTRGEIPENAQCDVDKFKYEEADPWPDKLSGIENGLNEIVYDENGNPISLDDTTVSWTNGRQLESFNVIDENGNEVPFLSYTYDDKGIRTSKTYGDTTTYYTNIDGNVTSQYQLDENGNIINLAEFIYDSSDNVIGFTYEGETYFYLKNLQNDVLAVIDSNGELMAKYDYSTWGWHTGWSNDNIDVNIYDVNPFRYRSYIYDEEMSMCYLQSRYYITTFSRFLNSDLPEYAQLQKNDHAGFNLFAYCCNDPVNKTDSTGYLSKYDGAIALVTFVVYFVAPILLKDKSNKYTFETSKIVIDKTGLCLAKIKYYKSKWNKKTFQVVLGCKKDWANRTNINNNMNMTAIKYHSGKINSIMSKSGTGKFTKSDTIQANIYSFITACYLIDVGIKTAKVKYQYNLLWGKHTGKFAYSKANIILSCIFKGGALNGWYYF